MIMTALMYLMAIGVGVYAFIAYAFNPLGALVGGLAGLYTPASLAARLDFSIVYPLIAWLSWVPNLAVAEWMYVRRKVA